MKLIVKSDDYGFTKGVTLGTLDGIENGIITTVGLFVNMPSSEFAVRDIQKLPQVCLGLDFNITSGKSISNKELIPNLVDDEGYFVRSTVKFADPLFLTDHQADLWPYDEVMIELKAQLNRFKELCGKEPEYLNGHSISQFATHFTKAISDLSKEVNIPYSKELIQKYQFTIPTVSYNEKPFATGRQIERSSIDFMKKHVSDFDNAEYGYISGHCGFVDAEIFKWSTYTIIRLKDHEMFTSEFMKDWIRENHIELISFRDLK